jgi:peptidoglycan/xylan/chitin deacetylase (PgdA/CDA1 family)
VAERPTSLAVLMYHSVGGPMPEGLADLSVPTSELAEHLAALRADGFELLGLTDALAAAGQGRRVVALTFDDGYRDFVDNALPVLVDAGAGATLYVPTDHLGGTAAWLPAPADRLPLLDAGDLVELPPSIEVGSHGAQHVPLDVIDHATAAEQLRRSRRVLEERLGRPVPSFCYPHGYHSASLRRAVTAAGYSNACAIGHRPHRLGDDVRAVARVMVVPGTTPDALRALVAHGPGGMRPTVARLATPAWRVARRTALRTAGVRWT